MPSYLAEVDRLIYTETVIEEVLMDVLRTAILAVGGMLAGLLAPVPTAATMTQGEQEPILTPVAFQAFQRGFMLWRQDNGQITVAFSEIPTKTGAPCQEVYRDTFQEQPYETGLGVPTLGFGWIYANDQQMARRLGYTTADEVSRVAEVRTIARPDGDPTIELRLSEPIPGAPNPLVIAYTDEPGLSYCFARGSENRAALNTWIALQRFEHGFMAWRQDRPDRVEVVHYDTDLAPELWCGDRFPDTWRPGEVLSYGDLAVPGRRLPDRGFGKVWLENAYVRESLGYPIEAETGGFAEVTFEPFQHPRRGQVIIRRTVVQLPAAPEFRWRTFFEGATNLERETRLTRACSRILIPHQPR
jgi:hypothetical protein